VSNVATIGEGNLYRVNLRSGATDGIIGRVQVAAVSRWDAADAVVQWMQGLPEGSALSHAYVATIRSADITVRKTVSPNDPFLVRYPDLGSGGMDRYH
jgi:hypothetical protein